jgi:uncharacterized delta-60 repeat protein
VLSAGTSTTVAVSIARSSGSSGAVQVKVTGLARGVTAQAITIPAGATRGSITLTSRADAEQGFGLATVRAVDDSGAAAKAPLRIDVRGRPGTVDTTFDGGSRTLDFGRGLDHGTANVLLPDGRIVVGGATFTGSHSYPFVARYLPDGKLDPTFAAGGVVIEKGLGTDEHRAIVDVSRMAVQPDGKLVVLLASMKVLRYDEQGQRDPTFGTAGVAAVDFGTTAADGNGLALQPDGRIVVVGSASVTQLEEHFGLLRLATNGSYDPSFGTNGRVVTSMSSAGDFAVAVGLDVTGATTNAIVVAGSAWSGEIAVARYVGSNGDLDPGFHGDGKLLFRLTPHPESSSALGLVMRNGKLVILAYDSRGSGGCALVRVLAGGTLDPTFGASGVSYIPFVGTDGCADLALRSTGGIVVAGRRSYGNDDDMQIYQAQEDGRGLSPSFGTNGVTIVSFGPGFDGATAVAVQNDDRIVVTGLASIDSDHDVALVRLATDGTLDPTFGAAGKIHTNIGKGDDVLSSAMMLADGRILATGASFNGSVFELLALRLTATGYLDPTFGTGGIVRRGFPGRPDYSVRGQGIALQPDGKIVVGGAANLWHAVARFMPDGAPDTEFGQGGLATSRGFGPGRSFAFQADGELVVAGGSGGHFGIARFTGTGTASSFGRFGVVETSFGSLEYANAVVVQPGDQKLIAVGEQYLQGGTSTRDWAAARYLPNGALDPSFHGDGKLLLDLGADDVASAIALQADGKILIGGTTGSAATSSFIIARYSDSGAVDATFGAGGRASASAGAQAEMHAVVLQPDGAMIGVGCGGAPRQSIVLTRWDANGAPDPKFGAAGTSMTKPGAASTCARASFRLPDGKLLVVGSSNDGLDDDALVVRYWN